MIVPVALVGAGVIGRNHAAAIARHPGLRLAAVVDPDPVARQAIAGPAGAAPYPTLAECLARGGIQLVVIATPSGLHAEAVEAAVAAGAHVLVEKPLDASLSRARRLAQPTETIVSVVSQHRFDPASVAVADAVRAGRLGRITSAVASVPWWRGQEYYDSADWRGTWALDGGGALTNQGVHTVDLLLWLLGRPEEVFGYAGRLAHERIEVEDVAVAVLRFASGALATVHATTAAYPERPVRLAVHGTTGSAVLHDDRLEYPADLVPPAQRYGADRSGDDFVLGHLRQYDDLVDAIGTGRRPGVTVDDGLLALATVRAVYVSAALHRPVPVAEVLAGTYDEVPAPTR